jgi:hypothetical protein
MRKKWLLAVALLLLAGLVALIIAARVAAGRIAPYLREQTIAYLSERFASDVELAALDISMPLDSPVELLLRKGKGAVVTVVGRQLSLRFRGNEDLPPMIQIAGFRFQVDLPTIWEPPARVKVLTLEGLQLHIPPKGRRPRMKAGGDKKAPAVVFEEIRANGTKLAIAPQNPEKAPLHFEIHQLTMHGAQPGSALRYDAVLTNAKPPGRIQSSGHFGPWASDQPGQTPLDGTYQFDNADLGVFKGIAGILHSTGTFSGRLERIVVDGETRMNDFRLKKVNQPLAMRTTFHAIVDGTDGDTLLQPVRVQLGRTWFTARGSVVHYEGPRGKTVALDVKLTEGRVDDLLRLAMKGGKPILRGGIQLGMKFLLPPGQGEIADRLKITGQFSLEDARFTTPTVQDQIDTLSRRGQGRPKDAAIDEVPSSLGGSFKLADGVIEFDRLRFTVPGAAVALKGKYLFDNEEMDFRGDLRLDAKVSQTMTGWKRWVLKPVDPFLAKEGAGTLLRIKVDGTRSQPHFGRDRGK